MRAVVVILAMALLATPAVAAEPDVAAAKAFVARLYAAYSPDRPAPNYVGRLAPQVFTPEVVTLIRRSVAMTPKGDVPPLDGDPICDCQDFTISDVAVTVVARDATHARADVAFKNFGEPQTATLDLVAVAGQWRVGDIHTTNTPSLVGLLRDSFTPAR